ncbi:hypothetical protein, partial [Candidatus Cardinium sp. cBcalN2]
FKENAIWSSLFVGNHLPKNKYLARLLNNSYIQCSTFCRKGSEMFKFILNILPDRLRPNQLGVIAIDIDRTLGNCGYAATLRSILFAYVKEQYHEDPQQVGRYVNYKRHFDYLEHKYGKDSKKIEEYVNRNKQLVDCIDKQ